MTPPTPKVEVKRWRVQNGHRIRGNKNGEWVHFNDYKEVADKLKSIELAHAKRGLEWAARFQAAEMELESVKVERDTMRAERDEAFTKPALLQAYREEVRELRAKLDAAVRERDAEYKVRKHVLHALSGQGLPKVLPEHGYGVIEDAHRLCVESDELRAKLAALTAHMNQVQETLGGSDTVLTLEAAQHVVAKLAEAEKDAERLDWMEEQSEVHGCEFTVSTLRQDEGFERDEVEVSVYTHETRGADIRAAVDALRAALDTARTAATAQGDSRE
jgi:hypothetical protein